MNYDPSERMESIVVQGPDDHYGVGLLKGGEEFAIMQPYHAISLASAILQDAIEAMQFQAVADDVAERVARPVDDILKQLTEDVAPVDAADLTGADKLAMLEQMGFKFKETKTGKVTISTLPADVVQAATERAQQTGAKSDGD